LRETRPPVPEDRPAREARRLHASQKKQAKETAKKRAIRKAKKAEALKKRRRQQAIDGVPLSPSPSETVSGEDDGSSDEDEDALSRYEIATRLGDLPDIRPLLEPIGGRSSSVVVVEEVEGKKVEKGSGPSRGGAILPRTRREGSSGTSAPAGASQAPAGAETVVPASSSAAAPVGVRTRGQLASGAQRAQGGVLAGAPRSARPAGEAAAGPPAAVPGGSSRAGSRYLVPISG
jgi:hypothetical protein